jgi:hypothetical protein
VTYLGACVLALVLALVSSSVDCVGVCFGWSIRFGCQVSMIILLRVNIRTDHLAI